MCMHWFHNYMSAKANFLQIPQVNCKYCKTNIRSFYYFRCKDENVSQPRYYCGRECQSKYTCTLSKEVADYLSLTL
jgi:hypothetical protein